MLIFHVNRNILFNLVYKCSFPTTRKASYYKSYYIERVCVCNISFYIMEPYRPYVDMMILNPRRGFKIRHARIHVRINNLHPGCLYINIALEISCN